MNNQPDPVISVIIPTRNRPELVRRAVSSALNQTFKAIEVVGVVDGPDGATIQVLRQMVDDRLHVLALPERGGVGDARNAGIKIARGKWIALLDDDDEWLPKKLEMQLEAAQNSLHRRPVISCKFVARKKHGDVVLPRRVPTKNEPLSEYLFCQKSFLGGEGLVLPSSIFTVKDLNQKIPFRYKQLAHEGSDWLLRAIGEEDVGVEFVKTSDPLVIWHADENVTSMSHGTDWRNSLSWAESNSDLLTSRAYASFILIRASLEAKRAGAWSAFLPLLWQSFRSGSPTLVGIVAHISIWFIPESARFRFAALMTGRFAGTKG